MKTGLWKIIFTIVCLFTAAGVMIGGMQAEASEEAEEAEETTDVSGPSISVTMSDGRFYENQYYYRQDNCGMEIVISDAESGVAVIEVMIGSEQFILPDFQQDDTDGSALTLSIDATQMSALIPEDGTVRVMVYAEDEMGNGSSLGTNNDIAQMTGYAEPSEETRIRLQGLTVQGEYASFILDRTAPTAVITYSSEAPFYLYEEEGTERAYVAAAVGAAIRYEDDQPLDDNRITIERDDVLIEPVPDRIREHVYHTVFDTEASHHLLTYGTDTAGNPLMVTEMIEGADLSYLTGQNDSASDGRYLSDREGEDDKSPHFDIVIDQTPPAFTLSLTEPAGEESVVGDAVFYGSVHKSLHASYEISEAHFDADRIGAGRVLAKDAVWNASEERMVTGIPDADIKGGDGFEKNRTYTVQVRAAADGSSDGIFYFGIEGTDQAGNPVVMSNEESQKEGYQASVQIKEYGYWTHEKILDTHSPSVRWTLPQPDAYATEDITKHHPDGRGLYRDDVTAQVQIEDAQMMECGIPLKAVYEEVTVNGNPAGRDRNAYKNKDAYVEKNALANARTAYAEHITFPKGGVFESNDITAYVNAVDYAGNHSEAAADSRIAFGIDSEGPAAEVVYDNNEASHTQYFRAPRTASIRISDRNIDESSIRIETQGTVPAHFTYSSGSDPAGNDDLYSKRIAYEKDGEYTLKISGTDALGNPFQTETVYQGTAPEHFVIDRTPPVIRFEGVENNTAYSGRIAPQVTFSDANFSKDLVSLTMSGTRGGERSDLLPELLANDGGGTYAMSNIAVRKENDDIYTVTAGMEDLAGNQTEAEMIFSVNRYGSTFDYGGDPGTRALLDAYYTNREQNLILREINVSRLAGQKVTVYRDGSNVVLKEGADYRVTEKIRNGSVQYLYEIYAKNFEKEGNYNVIVQSRDAAGNINSNGSIRQEEGIDAVPLKFAVDKTPPQIQINGSDIRRAQVMTEEELIRIAPYDNMRLSRVEIEKKSDADPDYQSVFVYASEELPEALRENNGALLFSFHAENGSRQTARIRAGDAAGNVSEGNIYYVAPGKRSMAETPEEAQKRSSHFGIIMAAAGAVMLISAVLAKRRRRA